MLVFCPVFSSSVVFLFFVSDGYCLPKTIDTIMNAELVRYIDSIHRDRGIDKEVLFVALEDALTTAIRKHYDLDDDFYLNFDRETGQMESNYELQFEEFGRIFAQTVKQNWFTRIREAERDVLYREFEEKIGDIITGTVQRFEGDSVVVSLGKVEGFLPRSEKVRGEIYHVGDRVRTLVLDVKKVGLKVRITLSRASTGLVRRLFELEVPEIADGILEIRKLEREPGYRTKIAVNSTDSRVDCVGACVGVHGTRIKSIIDELGGERIDIIRWTDDPQQMLINALKPAEVSHIQLDEVTHKALVLVEPDNLSLAIGRRGQNVRLASQLTGWDIDIMTRAELEETLAREEEEERKRLAGEDGIEATGTTETTGTTEATEGGELSAEEGAKGEAEPTEAAATSEPEGLTTIPASDLPQGTPGEEAPEDPLAEAPLAETPLAETPLAEAPLAETPLAETPLAETPLTAAPHSEAPLAEAPPAEAGSADSGLAESPESGTLEGGTGEHANNAGTNNKGLETQNKETGSSGEESAEHSAEKPAS